MQEKRMIGYKVVAAHDVKDLEKTVNDMMAQGWEPWGDLSVAVPVIDSGAAPMFSQAMVRRQSQRNHARFEVPPVFWTGG